MNYLKRVQDKAAKLRAAKQEKKQQEAAQGSEEQRQRRNTMIVLRRKQVVGVSLIVLVAVAGYLNWTFTNDNVDPDVATMYTEASKKLGEAQMVSGEATAAPTETNYFTQSKMDRDIKRSESIEMLMEIINNPNTDKEARTIAETDIHTLADNTERETSIENQIKAKGFANAVAFITEDTISVAVETEGLNKQDAAVIQGIVQTVTDMKAEQIKIVEIKPQA